MKRNQDKKLFEISGMFLEESTRQTCGYPSLDAGLNIFVIFSFFNHLGRVALQRQLISKGASNKKF